MILECSILSRDEWRAVVSVSIQLIRLLDFSAEHSVLFAQQSPV